MIQRVATPDIHNAQLSHPRLMPRRIHINTNGGIMSDNGYYVNLVRINILD
jgi:hypothetical protein